MNQKTVPRATLNLWNMEIYQGNGRKEVVIPHEDSRRIGELGTIQLIEVVNNFRHVRWDDKEMMRNSDAGDME